MALIVPGRGWNFQFSQFGGVAEYGVLGPFAAVDYVRFLYLRGDMNHVGLVRFGAAFGGSSEASLEAMTAGTSLIQRSEFEAPIGGQPSAVFGVTAWAGFNAQIACGFRGGTGSQWVICAAQAQVTEEYSMRLLVSAEVLRIERRPGVFGGD